MYFKIFSLKLTNLTKVAEATELINHCIGLNCISYIASQWGVCFSFQLMFYYQGVCVFSPICQPLCLSLQVL